MGLIVADANMPYAQQAFAQFGDVKLLPGRAITRADVIGAGALMVRSVTQVNEELLHGTSVRFVGTATIGTDHLDIPWLDSAGVRWASAAGCNARSVVEWVLGVIFELCLRREETWVGKTLGVIGYGNIGSRLAPRARALGMKVLLNDPPLARLEEREEFLDLDEVLERSDIVTLHVPLQEAGPDRTVGLIGERELGLMKPGAILLNASRGPVVDVAAATHAARSGRVRLALDVFDGEPDCPRDLVRACELVSSHIAGYSYEGKVNGTRMMANELGKFLRQPTNWEPMLPPAAEPVLRLRETSLLAGIITAVRHSYDIREDDAALRSGLDLEGSAWPKHFDDLRKNYRQRREFANYTVEIDDAADADLVSALKVFSFTVVAGNQ